MKEAIHELLDQPGIWRANDPQRRDSDASLDSVPSGFAALDRVLPGGGFPGSALTEILHEGHGAGELRLVMPALARLSRSGRWIAMIAPPFVPYAPALAAQGIDLSRLLIVHPGDRPQALWSIEQALRSGTCAAALAWPSQCDDRSLRRLQLAAESGNSIALLFRDAVAAQERSPAALRLALGQSSGQQLNLRVLKCRGTPPGSVALDSWSTAPVRSQQPLPLED